MSNLSWHEAITTVLSGSTEAMHYTAIAEEIANRQLRSEFGATPANSVNSTISLSIQNDGVNSPFIRVDRGRYWLRSCAENPQVSTSERNQETSSESDETGLINAFGMYWSRNNVLWTSMPKILGQQQPESAAVNFYGQKGVYLLHDGRTVIYVGRTTEQPLGMRLRQHTSDRLNGRWDRFSWFGVYSVTDEASLNTGVAVSYDLSMLIVTMEALLIEGLEPPQNRKRGDDFRAIEFLQVEDPEIQKSQIINLMDELKSRL